MTTLMAQIANKVNEDAKLASVTELDMTPESPDPELMGKKYAEVPTPKEVISALDTAIEYHLGHGNEMKESGKEEAARFQFSCAETMHEILILLTKADEHHLKMATLAYFSAKNGIQNQIPKVVYNFLVPKVSGAKKLQEYFSKIVSAKAPKVVFEGIELLAEDVFSLIQSSVEVAKTQNAEDPKSEQALQSAAHYMALLVSFMQVDKQTNTPGEEELRSYVPVGSMYRNEVQQSLDKFAQFLQTRGKDLDFGRFDPTRIVQQYEQFLAHGNPDQWDAVGKQLFDYYKKREGQQAAASERPQVSAHDNYEMRARAENQGQQQAQA